MMNIRTSFYFFMGMAFSFSTVICQPLRRWVDLGIVLNGLYGENGDVRTFAECEKDTDIKLRLLLVFETMGDIAVKNIRNSVDDYLDLPLVISENEIHSEIFQNISEIKKTYEANKLIEPLCKLIHEKCFRDKNFENENNFKLNVEHMKEMARADCEIDGKIEFSYSVVLEHLEERNQHFTAFVYKITQLTDSIELTFLACLPLMYFPVPFEVKVENEEP